MKKYRGNGAKTPVYKCQTPMPPVNPAKQEPEERIFYLCDRRACARCSPECSHTIDIRHAANFKCLADGSVWESLDDAPEASLFCDELGTGRKVIIAEPISSPSCAQKGDQT